MGRAGLFDGLADDSGEGSSEHSTGTAKKKAKTPKTPSALRLSKPDHTFSQLMHRFEEMDRHQAAADAREVRHSAAIQAASMCMPEVFKRPVKGVITLNTCL